MRLVVTGGGTGGHVYPALEVARSARAEGWDVRYFGSLRGQEGAACLREDVPFLGFPAEPLVSLRTFRGWRASARLLRAVGKAKAALRAGAPDVVFSTGGYSAAPIVAAARALGLPHVIHEQNSVPGRTNRLAAKRAYAVATTFHAAEREFPGSRVVRTGLPVRETIRRAALPANGREEGPMRVLAVGGSQGAGAINAAVADCARGWIGPEVEWTHVAGRTMIDEVAERTRDLGEGYRAVAFLEAEEMALAYRRADVVLARAGAGTLAELAAFGLPSVLIPFPLAFANHQLHNANEFAGMGAATVVPQTEASAVRLGQAIAAWIEDRALRGVAKTALREWDVPEAADRVLELLREAVQSR
ncbi:MAG: undecaprenyldiphospho-muramoylpentapeptide beta-N-acetylglucosaminyltransferase [Fimbriimonadaceae bacterium]|nr:undecaprenyldiphospho-muramoylpentapeptide beta-N-acetylglucosaminyltransferase [Chthonomonadaceae bacterium]MCO5297606.1 undecaprenyldiphospho-muramoylpentapeptide beta-N-acetylglucosaminyltransferase [Fimbriimonadaceae bacterium]